VSCATRQSRPLNSFHLGLSRLHHAHRHRPRPENLILSWYSAPLLAFRPPASPPHSAPLMRLKRRHWSIWEYLLSLASAAQAGRIASRIRYRHLRKSPGQNSPLPVHSPTNRDRLSWIGNFRIAEARLRNARSIAVKHLHRDQSRDGPSFRRPALNIRWPALSWSSPTRSTSKDNNAPV
jgi:hypothetical protein